MRGTWPQIVGNYRKLLSGWDAGSPYAHDVEGVAAVAGFINSTWLRDCLFGPISMHGIWISQTDLDVYLTESPHLRLEPNAGSGVRFCYLDGAKASRSGWQRVVAPEQTVDRFLRFLDQLRWVSDQEVKKLATAMQLQAFAVG